jgi:hypothetical protein
MSYADLTGPYLVAITNGVKSGAGSASEVWYLIDLDQGGVNTFSVPLCLKSDPLTITHWATYTMLEPEVHTAVTTYSTSQLKTWLDARAIQLGRTPLDSINPALPNSMSISEARANPWAYIDSLGLQVFRPPE